MTAAQDRLHEAVALLCVLHDRGLQFIRAVPGMSPSGMHWRLFVSAAPFMSGPLDRNHKAPHAAWSNGVPEQVLSPTPEWFTGAYPQLAEAGRGVDQANAEWMLALRAETARGRYPYFYSDWGGDLNGGAPVLNAPKSERFALPPDLPAHRVR